MTGSEVSSSRKWRKNEEMIVSLLLLFSPHSDIALVTDKKIVNFPLYVNVPNTKK